jgi:hypothetical protein
MKRAIRALVFSSVAAVGLVAVTGSGCSSGDRGFPTCQDPTAEAMACSSCVAGECQAQVLAAEEACGDYYSCYEMCACEDAVCLASCRVGAAPQCLGELSTSCEACASQCSPAAYTDAGLLDGGHSADTGVHFGFDTGTADAHLADTIVGFDAGSGDTSTTGLDVAVSCFNSCTTAGDCCGGTPGVDCEHGSCCVTSGENCSIGVGCCNALPCHEGTCCVGPGSSCSASSDCCPVGIELAYTCMNGACCIDTGGSCGSGDICCNGLPCTNGTCCLPAGSSCDPTSGDPGICCSIGGQCQ